VTITADYQAEIRGVTIGAGTDYPTITKPWDGVADLAGVRATETKLPVRDGVRSGQELYSSKLLTFQLLVAGSSPADAQTLLSTLKTAWLRSSTDVPLDLRLPGMTETTLRYYGRPRDLQADLRFLEQGSIEVIAHFLATDPYTYGAEVTTNVTTSATVGNAGDVEGWPTLVINGAATSPFSVTVDGHTISFATTIGVGHSVTVDTKARTAVTDASVDVYGYLAVSPDWAPVPSGGCTVSQSGAASVDVKLRPAYL